MLPPANSAPRVVDSFAAPARRGPPGGPTAPPPSLAMHIRPQAGHIRDTSATRSPVMLGRVSSDEVRPVRKPGIPSARPEPGAFPPKRLTGPPSHGGGPHFFGG